MKPSDGIRFRILDTDGEITYGLYFRYDNIQIDHIKCSSTTNPILDNSIHITLGSEIEVIVKITPNVYKVTVNGEDIQPSCEVDLDALQSFKSFSIRKRGSSMSVDQDKSYVQSLG